MTGFVESCVGTVAGSAVAAERRARGRPRAAKLMRLLRDKKNVLITTHDHPDPDALASGTALAVLLRDQLKDATVSLSICGKFGGGINEVFVRTSDLNLVPWNESALSSYDAIILLDTQPTFAYNPLPPTATPLAVIDHHRSRRRTSGCRFCDIRTDVGATSSIIFSYFMELEVPIKPDLGATLLFGIESDLAGAAGTPGELDTIALSSLTLLADPRKLYQMRHVDLPQSYYAAYYGGIANAFVYDNAIISHLDAIDSLEKPAVIADFLLRYEKVNWSLVTAPHEGRLFLSLRTSDTRLPAADMMQRLLRQLGEGGGHRHKAGGFIRLETGSAAELEKLRVKLRQRFLRALHIGSARGQRLVPKIEA